MHPFGSTTPPTEIITATLHVWLNKAYNLHLKPPQQPPNQTGSAQFAHFTHKTNASKLKLVLQVQIVKTFFKHEE